MPVNPSKSLHFESWDQLLEWLPEANENQLVTVFVWAGQQQAPLSDARRLGFVRKEAFEQLVLKTRERLERFLVQRVGCHDQFLAEDVVQQVLVKLFLRAEQFDPQRSFWGWLYRIARNEYIDALRRTRPGDVGLGQVGQADDEAEQWLEKTANNTDTPIEVILEDEQREQLEQAIAALPSLQRTVVQLKRRGEKGKDIASRLGISQAYVSQLFHEAGECLREAIEL